MNIICEKVLREHLKKNEEVVRKMVNGERQCSGPWQIGTGTDHDSSPFLWLADPDPYGTKIFSDFKDAKKLTFSYFLLL